MTNVCIVFLRRRQPITYAWSHLNTGMSVCCHIQAFVFSYQHLIPFDCDMNYKRKCLTFQELHQSKHKRFYVKPVETVSYGSSVR
jgi:hypothetical protein